MANKRSRANPTPEEFAAILNDFARRSCSPGCKCMLCQEFDRGYLAGIEAGAKAISKAIETALKEAGHGQQA